MDKGYLFVFLAFFCMSLASADLVNLGSTGGEEVLLGYGNQVDLFFSAITAVVPTVTQISPTTGTLTYEADQLYIYNISTTKNIAYCSLIIDGVTVASDNNIEESQMNSIPYLLTTGTYTWSIKCVDQDLGIGSSENFTIEITDHPGYASTGTTYYSKCYKIVGNKCESTTFQNEECPDDYFPSLSKCMNSFIIGEINETSIEKIIDWLDILDYDENKTIDVDVKNKIPKDVSMHFSNIALKITPSSEGRGKIIILLFLIFIIFFEDIFKLTKKIKAKDTW